VEAVGSSSSNERTVDDMTVQSKLLVVDDEPSLQDIVATSMRFLGYDVTVASTGREAVRAATDIRPDLIILDIMLPDFDGLEVMRRLRAVGVDAGVVFLSARDTPADKIAGLSAGGDDYVTKPFGLEELAARVSAVLRRVRPELASDGLLKVADLELDPETYQVSRAGVPIELAPTEYKMLRHLMINANVVLSRQQLLDAVWGTDFYGDDSVVATYISYLRRKVDAAGDPLIHTHRGFGYVLRAARRS
jgi:two-component system OmpR family response regulator